jgi:hypothetical protein
MVALLHRDTALGIIHAGGVDADFALSWKTDPASAAQIALVLALVLAVQWLPLLEELWRTWRQGKAATPSPACQMSAAPEARR